MGRNCSTSAMVANNVANNGFVDIAGRAGAVGRVGHAVAGQGQRWPADHRRRRPGADQHLWLGAGGLLLLDGGSLILGQGMTLNLAVASSGGAACCAMTRATSSWGRAACPRPWSWRRAAYPQIGRAPQPAHGQRAATGRWQPAGQAVRAQWRGAGWRRQRAARHEQRALPGGLRHGGRGGEWRQRQGRIASRPRAACCWAICRAATASTLAVTWWWAASWCRSTTPTWPVECQRCFWTRAAAWPT